MHAHVTCKNCGNQFTGNFCNECGEKVYSDHDKRFSHFLEEAFHFITHFDNKIFRSWWLIMTRPGFVSKQICDGIRRPYYKPVNLFIIGVILYLLFPIFQGLNMPLKNHLNELYSPVAERMVENKMKSKKLTMDQVAARFDAKSPKFAKILLLIIIPLSALAIQLLFLKKGRYFFDHITLASEINTFYLYFTFLLLPLLFIITYFIVYAFGVDLRNHLNDNISVPLHVTALAIYSTLAFIRFYNEKKVPAILKSVLFLAAHWLIVYSIYRFILFCIVLVFT
ncbi:MAG TPA: DUF3667 domain-containing protein [Chitinophagaceae bacterium]|nr:DUF3667 domain-containing protein [Chitinophagaceae bacterium]